jgi:class 3 adenylate cyclase
MPSTRPPHPGLRLRPLPRFCELDQMDGATTTDQSRFSTGFRDWLRRITATDHGATAVPREQVRLEALKKLLGSQLTHRVATLSQRDLRLYLRLMSASRLETLRDLRFECFDLLCRTISESVAVRQLGELDALLKP